MTTRDTLSITDNRTGKSYELPVADGTIKAIDLRQIKTSDEDFAKSFTVRQRFDRSRSRPHMIADSIAGENLRPFVAWLIGVGACESSC